MFCPDCGLKNRKGAKFCGNCGKSFAGLPGYKLGARRRSLSRKSPRKLGYGGSSLVKSKKKKSSRRPSSLQKPAAVPSISSHPPSFARLTPGLIPVGTVLDKRYKIVEHIATGGMGAIYKGEDTRLKTTIAIKEMLDFFQNHEDRKYAVQRFREEALLLADIRHPNVPRVTDNFIENNRYYLIMDFVEGKSTSKLLMENQGRGLEIQRVIWWGVQICDVLYYLHTHKPVIIYRDMKPSNIMIRADDSVMLVDFGIARHFTPRRPGTMIGTHGYAPPEQYKGNTEPRSDIYGLASTMHHLITGNDPTQGVPFNFKPISHYRKNVDPRLERIFKKALENRVEMRYINALEMKNDLLAVLKYRPPGTTVSAGKQAASRPSFSSSAPVSSDVDAHKHFTRAKNYVDRGSYRKAQGELEKALQISPDYPEAHSLLGYVLSRRGKTHQAVKHLNRAISLSPGSATAHLYLGKAYEKLGRYDESERELRIASRLDPELFKRHTMSFLEKLIRSLLT